MSQDEFDRHKEALAVKKLEKPKTVYSQFNLFYNEIALSQYHFERSEVEVEILRNITKDELFECYKVSLNVGWDFIRKIITLLFKEIHSSR